MPARSLTLNYVSYTDDAQLPADELMLLQQAREATRNAYAPYSHFQVGAALRLAGGQIVVGANQENASFPAGICAERVALSAVAAQYPGAIIQAMAISYQPAEGLANHPISPCGICRQTLLEYELRQQQPIRLILGGFTGEIIVVPAVQLLLPFSFTPDDLSAKPAAPQKG